jgi:hypothetical protein
MNGAGGTIDCISYINKLTNMAGTNHSLFISAGAVSYGNTNWYFDDTQCCYGVDPIGMGAEQALVQEDISSNSIVYTNVYPDCGSLACHITNGSNLAGYFCWGEHSSLGGGYASNGSVIWTGDSGWYLMETIESFNGERDGDGFQGNFVDWFAANAFNGTNYNSYNYTNTPVGVISTVDEPGLGRSGNPALYFGLWARGHTFGICAWNAIGSPEFQAVGDPFVTR